MNKTCLGYSLVGGFSRKTHIKGGVTGYAKNDIAKQIRLIDTSLDETEFICEMVHFKINTKKRNIQVVRVYRPPNAKQEHAIDILNEQLIKIIQTNTQIIILGDINVNNLIDNSDNAKLEELHTAYDIIRLALPPT